ncbi:MAG: hypothetical protein M1587_07305 [Thaumarchaeota archaeon]|nr:hypothetical protein [Nitrososphaerota archaeon]
MISPTLLESLAGSILGYKEIVEKLKHYKSNRFYSKALKDKARIIKTSIKNCELELYKTGNKPLIKKFKKLRGEIYEIIDGKTLDFQTKVEKLEEAESSLLEIQVIAEGLVEKLRKSHFEIPTEIPDSESKKDLQEAIDAYHSHCYIAALVLCRRSYEGELAILFKSIEGKEPEEEKRCPKCNSVMWKQYIGVTNLHKWAIKKGLISDKFYDAGILLKDIGAGAAHPPLSIFPRDIEIAKLGIQTTITLLKQLAISQKPSLSE